MQKYHDKFIQHIIMQICTMYFKVKKKDQTLNILFAFIPTLKHFFKRQKKQSARVFIVITQSSVLRLHTDLTFWLFKYRTKNFLHASHVTAPKCRPFGENKNKNKNNRQFKHFKQKKRWVMVCVASDYY